MTPDIPHILCAGSVLWDMIGRTDRDMQAGDDRPGHITRLPGGVAMNIAMTLTKFGLHPALLTVIGRDEDGNQLMQACAGMGLDTQWVLRRADLPTDRYMAVESAGKLIAAIADAHSLEQAGDEILKPLRDGRLGDPRSPYPGVIALDGNLTESLLGQIATAPEFSAADLRVAPASPGKATRLMPFVRAGRGTLYVNLEEAGLLCGTQFHDAVGAAGALVALGAQRAIVTHGDRPAADATSDRMLHAQPPQVRALRVTGAGDTFMAAHIAAELDGAPPQDALCRAIACAADYVSRKDPA